MTLLHQAAQKAVEQVPRYNWDQDMDVLAGPYPDGEWVRHADVIAALQQQPEPVAGEKRGEAQRKADERMHHDYPLLQQFHSKHALGALAAPSCLCCGQQTHPVTRPVVVQHMELPAIVICKQCKDAARPALQHQEVPREPVARPSMSMYASAADYSAAMDGWIATTRQCPACKGKFGVDGQACDLCNATGRVPSTTRQQEVGSDIVEAIARQWDGCMAPMFDATGNPTDAIDIGATIRADGIPAAAPSPLQREVGSGYEFAGGFIQNRNANGSTRWEQVSKQYENDADVVKLYRAAAPSTPEKAGGVSEPDGAKND